MHRKPSDDAEEARRHCIIRKPGARHRKPGDDDGDDGDDGRLSHFS